MKEYCVYIGKLKNKIVYVGTTIQNPKDRFRWHKNNGKNFDFEVIKIFDNSKEMLDKEYELIKNYNPKYNKIKHRKQNFNQKLDKKVIQNRIGDDKWCQKCLKRKVNKGFTICYFCEKESE